MPRHHFSVAGDLYKGNRISVQRGCMRERIDDSGILGYLQRMQQSACISMHGFTVRDVASVTSVYRWRRTHGDRLLAIPNVNVEYLGLLHAHIIARGPEEAWRSCPYAVEAAWITPDLLHDGLYVHCLVPASHQRAANALFATLGAQQSDVVWSGSGWQQFVRPFADITIPQPIIQQTVDEELLRRHPLVAPVLMEVWRYPNSMPMIWWRIRHHVPEKLQAYLPGQRVYPVNGKRHVRDALQALSTAGLISQHLVRYHPLFTGRTEVFLLATLDKRALVALLERLRDVLGAIETYPTSDGYFCRLLGSYELIDRLMTLAPADRAALRIMCWHTKRHPGPTVRFRYEKLFAPHNGTWRDARAA